jgi:osmoprotectant transport system ATP-binding protein
VKSVAISFREVVKSFGEKRVLDRVSLEVAPGEVLVLLGRSGCGKTTLLRLVNRLVEADSGEVYVGGREVADWDPVELRRGIGYAIQGVGLLPHLSVSENVALVPRLLGSDPEHRRERAAEMLRLVGLDAGEHGDRRPDQLSGGQRQRVGVARALAADPQALLMDEPFGAVDPISRRSLQDEFRSLSRELGKTVLFVTHDVSEAFRLADRIAVVADGGIRQLGTPREIREAPADDLVRGLIEGAAVVDAA